MTTSSQEAPKKVKLSSLNRGAGADAEWVDLEELLGVRLKVRPIDYPEYTKARQVLFRRLGRSYKDAPVPENILIPALGKLYAEHILVDWDGFDEAYSADLAAEMLGDWEWRDLVRQVEWAAGKLASVNTEFVEDAAKN
jgi:hypothetical protein